MADEENWQPAPLWGEEQADLNAEMRRLVLRTREVQVRRETLERKLRDRLQGHAAVPASDWLEQADEDREQANGKATYPRAWAELAALARQMSQRGIRPRRGRYDKDSE